jgi:phenylalanyl-tRNA synthetase beta chain
MQFPESWLREFCNPPLTTHQLADTLTMGGLEVEDLRPVAPPFTGVVVGQIIEAMQHPNADRLRICQVDVGQGALLSIVCGAPNARAGIKVPCALVGAELPPGEDGKTFQIKLGSLRGVESQGMLCSARELKLSEDHGGLLELAPDAPLSSNVRDWLKLDDTIFTLKLTPNLAHALSVYGVARELSALADTTQVKPQFSATPVTHADKLAVTLHAPDLCGRFSGRIVRGVNTRAQTPAWMVERLARCGQRSINPLVDISNYVMFEFGRPSHIFDLDKIHGGLHVRWGKPGEQLKLLNGNTVTVDESVGVIADTNGLESLAGIMGGDATSVSDGTQNIYIEAAFWWPHAIQGRSRRYNFSTDAGHRFERGVDPSSTVDHLEHITRLVLDICGGSAGPINDQVTQLPQLPPVTLRVARAAKVIGMPLTQQDCAQALTRLALSFVQADGTLTVTSPPHRFDLTSEEDLIEEVARVIGYNQLPDSAPLAPIAPRLRHEAQRSTFSVRRQLATLGYQETINFSFVNQQWEQELAGQAHPIKLLNPMSSQMSVMRTSLLGSLLQVLKFNLDRKADRIRIFEIGRVFLRDAAVATTDTTVHGIYQPMRVSGLAYGDNSGLQWGSPSRVVDFFDAKGDLQALLSPSVPQFEPGEHPALHPGRCARIVLSGKEVGWVGELHPRWKQSWDLPVAPVLFELSLDAVLTRSVPVFHPVPKSQSVQRDLAVIVAETVTHAALMQAVRAAATGGLLRDALLFDLYRPKQSVSGLDALEKSLAVRLTLCGDDATLTDAQIDQAVLAVVSQIERQVGGRLRS